MRSTARHLFAIATVIVAACNGRSSNGAPAPSAGSAQPVVPTLTGSAPVPTPVVAASGKADKPGKPSNPSKPSKPPGVAITPEVRAAYLSNLQKGQKLAKAKQWKGAIAAFEAALQALPGDDRALSELSFAALSFGDFAKARDAGHRSVLAASSASVKAASLYNVGRVEEANGRLADAANLYRDSLALRNNKTVRERLAKVSKGDAAPDADEVLCSGAAMTEAALCACIAKHAEFQGGECTIEEVRDDFVVVNAAISDAGESVRLLAIQSNGAYRVLAHIGDVYNPGMMGISEEWELGTVEQQQVGFHNVLRFVSTHTRNDNDLGINETESTLMELVTYCVVAPGAAARCPLQFTSRLAYTRELLFADQDVEPDLKKLQTKGLPIHDEYALSAKLLPTGVVQLRTAKGNPEPSLLGDRPLF